MQQELLKTMCIIILAGCLGLMIYCIINAINTARKNKRTDEATRKMFMTQMAQNAKNISPNATSNPMFKQQLKEITPSRPTKLDYDKFEADEEQVDVGGKSLNDFFKQ